MQPLLVDLLELVSASEYPLMIPARTSCQRQWTKHEEYIVRNRARRSMTTASHSAGLTIDFEISSAAKEHQHVLGPWRSSVSHRYDLLKTGHNNSRWNDDCSKSEGLTSVLTDLNPFLVLPSSRSRFPILRWTTLDDKIFLSCHILWSRSDCLLQNVNSCSSLTGWPNVSWDFVVRPDHIFNRTRIAF